MNRARLRAIALFMLLAACASGPSASRGRLAAPSGPPQRFTAPGEPAAEYRTDVPDGDALRGPHALRASRGFARAIAGREHPPAPDPRLAQLAEWAARALAPDGSSPPIAAIELWAHHLGLYEPAPDLLMLAQSDAAPLEDRVAKELAPLLAQKRYTHYGAATLERDGDVLCVFALSLRWVELAKIPRRVEPGAKLELRGRLLFDLKDPQLAVSFPDGGSQRSAGRPGQAIALAVPLRGRGEERVELLATSALGDTVIANFPLYVGVAPVTEVEVGQGPPAGAQVDRALAEQHLLELLNQERARAGLQPLAASDTLARVARNHSEDMREHGFVGHVSPTTGDTPERVKAAGIRTPLVLENVGRGYSADEVHRSLMDSPGHRANVLNPDATHVGVGIAFAPEDARIAFFVTELFARFASKIDVAAAPRALLASVNRTRARRGLQPLAYDERLAGLCDAAARQMFRNPGRSREQSVQELSQLAARSHAGYGRLSALMTFASDLEEAATLDALLDPAARGAGIGVAQGTRPDTIDNAIAITALVGYR